MKCPACKKECGYRGGEQKHVVQVARFEVWQKALGAKNKTPHFDYYLKNTKQIPTYKMARTWDK